MIGKIYRPLQMLEVAEKRGYQILHKYKSNFGGTFKKFRQGIYLDYNPKTQTEEVRIEFTELALPIMVETDQGTTFKEKSLKLGDSGFKITSFRKLKRPQKLSSGDKLSVEIPIVTSLGKDEDMEVLKIELQPIVKANIEYMLLKVESITPVVIDSASGVLLKEKKV